MSINRGIKKDMVHIFNETLFNDKKNEIMPFTATWMDLESLIISEVRQKRRNIV